MSHQSAMYEVNVIDNIPFGPRLGTVQCFALRLERPAWQIWYPGQFVMVRPCGWGLEMPWARPFSISRVSATELVLFIQSTGRGTSRIEKLRRNDRVNVWGPLGNRFAMEETTPTLLVAGGIGIAPFVGYAERHPKPSQLTMLFGHRLPEECYPVETLGERIELEAYQDNNPADLEWFVSHISTRMEAYAERKGLVLACGPMPLLRTVQEIALKTGARTQLSLENRMACGVGACLGCVTTTTDKWPVPDKAGHPVQTCTQGPIFWAHQIVLEG